MGISESLAIFAVHSIQTLGYPSIFLLMTLESMVFPMPSEAVMPFAGWLIASGNFNWPLVILFSTLGSILGSSLSYAAGYYGGKPFVKRFGKFLFLNEHHLEITHQFFQKWGIATVFICRFIPVVRHLSSIPAGIAAMNFWQFTSLTIVGAGLWNVFLAYLGTLLQQHWQEIMKYSKLIDIIVLLLIAILIAWFIIRQIRQIYKAKTSK